MNFVYCWHRPGRVLKGEVRACRHCSIAVVECPCVSYGRNAAAGCVICEGSCWVAMVRSKSAALEQTLDFAG